MKLGIIYNNAAMRLVLSMLFVLACLINAQSQNYISFPDSNGVWQIGWGVGGGGFPGSGGSGSFQYVTRGDTIISSSVYTQLEIQGVSTPLWDHFQFSDEYVGAYRNDTINKTVYFVPKDSTSESVLYDFTLEVGDTVEGFLDRSLELLTYMPEEIMITSVDSIQIGLSYRKRIGYTHLTLNSGWDGYFIEGIGGDYGLLECLHAQLESNGTLNCFSQNEQVVYPTPSNSPCAPLALELTKKYDLQFFPNPANSFIELVPNHSYFYFRLYSMDGRKVRAGIIPETNRIDIIDISRGAYILHLMDEGFQKRSRGRLIVIED